MDYDVMEWTFRCDECGKVERAEHGLVRGWLEVKLVKGLDLPFEERQVGKVCGVYCSIGCLMEKVGRVGGWMRKLDADKKLLNHG